MDLSLDVYFVEGASTLFEILLEIINVAILQKCIQIGRPGKSWLVFSRLQVMLGQVEQDLLFELLFSFLVVLVK